MIIPYRADIDGLRAVAVLFVVLFHLGMPGIHGGYIGVDVFFVISGYLITSIIMAEIEQGSFSLLHFYERRVRRILPALSVVSLCCVLAAYFILFPSAFEYFGQTLAATAAFGSNILFWRESGYFEMESGLVPLLHMWSLAVEEQFYILFPLYLIIVSRFGRRWVVSLTLAGAAISFLIGVWGIENGKASATFYLLPPRAWELLAGSILSFSMVRTIRNVVAANILGLIGMGLIVYSGLRFNAQTLFPGYNALFPVIGACLVIYSGLSVKTFLSKSLGMRLPALIGKMSYSLYLWHWPLIVFYNHASPQKLDAYAATGIFIVSLFLSYLSWKYIEQPARKNKSVSQRNIFLLAALSSGVFVVVGLFIFKTEGMPKRFAQEIQKLSQADIGADDLPDLKFLGFEGFSAELGDPSKDFSFIVWGDSHARAAAPALDFMARQAGKRGYLLEDSGCMPAFDHIEIFEPACDAFKQHVLQFVETHPEIDRIIMIAYWSVYEKRVSALQIGDKPPGQSAFTYYMSHVFSALEALEKKIIFVTEVPSVSETRVPLYLARAKYYGQEVNIDPLLEDYFNRQKLVNETLEELAKTYSFEVLSPYEYLCNDTSCPVINEGHSLYYDSNHLSHYGAMYIREAYKPLFKN